MWGAVRPPNRPPLWGHSRPCLTGPASWFFTSLDKLLIRYEKLPLDYRAPFLLTLEPPGPLPLVSGRSASSSLASLSRYLYHRRWLWSVPSGLAPTLPLSATAQLLSVLTEVRLSEGFHFACSGEGIINMVLELPVQDLPFVHRTNHWGRLQLKRSIRVLSSTSSFPPTLPPLKTASQQMMTTMWR